MCDEAGDDCIAPLKLVRDWFVTSEMIKKLFTTLFADENILYFNEGSGDAIINCNGIGILNKDLNDIILDDNCDEDDLDTIILIRLLAWYIESEKCKKLKKRVK